jgi:hypothetical protein
MAIATVTRPCYCTREEVMRALDIKPAAYTAPQIDRKLVAAAGAVDGMCKRKFYPEDTTYVFDWPNYQYAYPWRLWLDQYEMAAQPTLVVSGTYLDTPVVIPTGTYFMDPINEGPPYNSLQLRRDLNSSFGNNTTPQNDIGITGTFGFWTNTTPCGPIAAAITSTTQNTVQMAAGPLAGAGVGDVLIIGSERMLVTDCNYISTGIATTGSGGNSAQNNDNTLTVPDGTQFSASEILLLDSEWMLIQTIYGNNIVVKRGWGGSVLTTHNNPTIWANRLLSVNRGVLGTSPSTYTQGTQASISEVPGLVKDVAIATAVIGITNEPSAYAILVPTYNSQTGSAMNFLGSNAEAAPGVGYQGLLQLLGDSIYVRKLRTRVI